MHPWKNPAKMQVVLPKLHLRQAPNTSIAIRGLMPAGLAQIDKIAS